METLLQNYFGLFPLKIEKLNGYENINYLVKTNNQKYIFKTYSDVKVFQVLISETEALNYLSKAKDFDSPKPIKFLDGSYVKRVIWNDTEILIRLISFVEGDFIGELNVNDDIVNSLGLMLGKLNLKLQSWSNYTIKSREFEWNLDCFLMSKDYIDQIESFEDRKLVQYFFQQYEFEVLPISGNLRKSIIHNDANEWNLLTKNGISSGIIDFGDISYAALINELAIAIVYISYRESDYLHWAEKLIASYHSIIPLEELELKVLYYKISLRLCVSACNSAKAKKENPKNKYITHSESKVSNMLRAWIKISPYHAENRFRKVCGFKALKTPSISSLISKRKKFFSSNIFKLH